MPPSPAWSDRALGPRLRPWQVHAVAALAERLARPDARACLVAPPGAGKTVCALAVAGELGAPVEVRVPTTALVAQWRERVASVLVATRDGAAEAPVRVATYASDADVAPDALVVLDEAHHTTAAWGAAVRARLAPGHRVLGLTATPPVGSSGWDRFVGLVGDDPVEIAAPPLVRDGQLCPYQDLAWPVLVDLDDLGPLRAADEALRAVESAVADRFAAWEEARLHEDLWTLTDARFAGESGLLVALCRLRNQRGASLPADLPADAELLAPPTLHDRALALWSMAAKDPVVEGGLRAAGFRLRASGPVLAEDVAWQTLAGSGARLRGGLDVLALEHRERGDALRALVVCDRDVEGDRLAARRVLRALVADPRTEPLDPVLVTGAVFWIDDDLWPRLASRLGDLPFVAAGGHHEVDVTAWPTGARVQLATRLLAEGVTRCLVGTRHLLGEGWDCPAVNVVVDLSGITAAVTTNQIRGRALRPDPGDPSKVASLWDVVGLAPGVPDGDRMLRELAARHAHTFGVDAAGHVRAGVARMDAVLNAGFAATLADLDGLRARMRARCGEGAAVVARWAVGRDYRDTRVWRVVGEAHAGERARLPPPVAPRPAGPVAVTRIEADGERRARRLARAVAIAGGVAGLLAAPFTPVVGPLLGVVAGVAAGLLAGRTLRRRLRARLDRDGAIVATLHAALREIEPAVGALRRGPEGWWAEGEASRRFAHALAELLGPVRVPRYLLVEADGTAWPVPEELAARRDLAEGLLRAWTERVGAATVAYARSPEGRLLLRELWRNGAARGGRVTVVEAWE
ncbi:MAG: DEAD/DEAH box helicase family protein [Myxococcota bacterium]